MIEKLKMYLVPALVHSLYSIVYVLFILPFDLWVKAIERLAKQKENGALNISRINSPWPYFTFLKNLCLDFAIDFGTMMAYPFGIIISFVMMTEGFWLLFVGLIGTYYAPVSFAFTRDCIQFMLLPIRKIISWFRKPAQYVDVNVKG